ncbi:MAG: hypothetical protein GY805_23340 [Chloroflexi bacterium]|nr:hypothetical protein [Chloroflexota bacterium]
MNEFLATVILIALFTLRFVVPLGISLGFAYMLNRLQNRWQTDENAA